MNASARSIVTAIKRAIELTESSAGIPGEGTERPFRGWLQSNLLEAALHWPPDRIVNGERFDIRLEDEVGFPVVNIETKAVGHRASAQERSDFESRLAFYPTIRVAYFTNGQSWDRIDIVAPAGIPTIQARSHINVDSGTEDEIEGFFGPLFPSSYLSSVPRESRFPVTSDHQHVLVDLTNNLKKIVSGYTSVFEDLLDGLLLGEAGQRVLDVTKTIFEQWCEKSLVVAPCTLATAIAKRSRVRKLNERTVIDVLNSHNFRTDETADVAEIILALPTSSQSDATTVEKALWPLYNVQRRNLCAQTAHVVLARALLYRIAEDRAEFRRLLSQEPLARELAFRDSATGGVQTPALALLNRIRLEMENFLPIVYKQGEFDWWFMEEKRATLNAMESAWLRDQEASFERQSRFALFALDGYIFDSVDIDVWRNIYQNYLPADERQRLGGFYTPDELVNLTLDQAGYTADTPGLCSRSFIDPACGSGAFVTTALARLLKHLEKPMPCHATVCDKKLATWIRAENTLRLVCDKVHGVDIHPFAAFLTTVNVLFLLLPQYVAARARNPHFSLDLWLFSADTLERPDVQLLDESVFARLNSRVQLSQASLDRYRGMYEKKFDLVVGNPPWGGVLKGPLAPVYGATKKTRMQQGYPEAASGKYDVYALFMQRAILTLSEGGVVALVTPDSYMYKEWAANLRTLIARKSSIKRIIDLNPFGNLFFGAMNTPCVSIFSVGRVEGANAEVVQSSKPTTYPVGRETNARRGYVVRTVTSAQDKLRLGEEPAIVDFATARYKPQTYFSDSAKAGWNLGPPAVALSLPTTTNRINQLLEACQGLTSGNLDLFFMTEEQARELGLEDDLIHPAFKSRDIDRWHVEPQDKVIFYPYTVSGANATPAFAITRTASYDADTRAKLTRSGLTDALDFDTELDARERSITRGAGARKAAVAQILQHRIALGIVKYPNAARHLVANYEELGGRVYEEKNIKDAGSRWYEYHRRRDPSIMFRSVRIVSPRLVQEVKFALDDNGYLSDDATIFLQPTPGVSYHSTVFKQRLERVVGRPVNQRDMLKYCLAFLNSSNAQRVLLETQRPTPKGYYSITERFLENIHVPMAGARSDVERIIDLVDTLITEGACHDRTVNENKLSAIVNRLLGL